MHLSCQLGERFTLLAGSLEDQKKREELRQENLEML